MELKEEIARRRTLGIVSHPDAGKTTLTEKLLLFGGAIHVAGAVKSNKIRRRATSDFMEIERQRGISVATSVMGFEYKGTKINILDTPGHQDFAEDTFRVLTACDSAIIVIDAARGVEERTRELARVCRLHGTPVMIFINKLDRPAADPFDILDHVERELQVRVIPLNWPTGSGELFKGIYNIREQNFYLHAPSVQELPRGGEIVDLHSDALKEYLGERAAAQLAEDIELVVGAFPPFDRDRYLAHVVAPVFFGSALHNTGIRELLDSLVEIAPPPLSRETVERAVFPDEEKFSGFVFKIHANMDPRHRDRIAFVKVCSGIFRRDTPYLHVRSGKTMKFPAPTAFMAARKSVIDEAYPGDIVGLHDTGNFKIGDTLTAGEKLHFKGIPSFSPGLFRYIDNADPGKAKQLARGIEQLVDEGVAQLFTSQFNNRKIIGTVGALQFEVIEYRLLHEYGASCRWEPLHLYKACWIEAPDARVLDDFKRRKATCMATDKQGRDVFLAESEYMLNATRESHEKVTFHFTSEF
ncbi:MAG: peptide chain release factor 3 [Odoribacteraceae bacterium]|jgi:peptide chain release factor 3|nr:peptide chain release factor 3 [Odoribacteraceae bacterium]